MGHILLDSRGRAVRGRDDRGHDAFRGSSCFFAERVKNACFMLFARFTPRASIVRRKGGSAVNLSLCYF